jgi:hypothetical protein
MRNALYDYPLFSIFGDFRAYRLGMVSIFPNMVDAEVYNDSVYPGVKRAFKAESIEVAIGPEKGLLVDILGVFLGPGNMHGKPEHSLIVISDQFLECGSVALLCATNHFKVVNLGGTARR